MENLEKKFKRILIKIKLIFQLIMLAKLKTLING
jgi:hypothetical protein